MKKQAFLTLTLIFFLSVAFVATLPGKADAAGNTYYVDDNYGNPPPGTGAQTDPFHTIQMGINTASAGDIVQVATGTYYENITMKSGVEILGAGAGMTTINGGGSGTVVNDNGADSSAKLEGFTVTNGAATWEAGGMSIYGSPTVANCIFSGNQAGDEGGGMYISASSSISPVITNCSFVNNSANNGGGMYIRQATARISNCSFTNNQATGVGGGIHISSSLLYGAPTITDCVFDSNKSTGASGGGIYNASDSSPTYGPSVTNCLFKNNQAFYDGGGICNGLFSWFKVTNCTFRNNSAVDGGGMANSFTSATNPRVVTNCVFYGNSASDKGGAIRNESSSPDITNCILWADTAGTSGNEIYNDGSSTPNVTYCYIEGIITGGGDPQFVNPSSGDFHLQPSSPCIDTGNNSAPSLPITDFENDQRIIDGDLDGTATVDIGVDEYTPPPSSVVWVDDDFTPGSAGGHTWGYDAFDNIRDGIDEVASPGIVHVAGGHYAENINMKDGVQVLGAGSAFTTIDGTNSGAAVQARWVSSGARLAGFRIINGSWTWGGGIHVHQSSDFTISNCEITENSGIHGGGLYVYDSTLTVANCTIWHNTAEEGAGMFFVDTSSAATIVNCTFWENVAESSGGGIYNSDSSPKISNCIIWGNLAGGSVGNEIYDHGSSSPNVTYCDVEGSYSGLANIDRDPAFFNLDGGNFRLRLGSPCIDGGTNAAVPAWLSHDLGGQTRIMDGNDDGSSIVDMGAYETEYTEPEIVCVDDDWAGLSPGSLVICQCYAYESPVVFGYDAFASIQDGIDAAVYYGDVCVAEGHYVENITITKSELKIEGAGPHITIIDGSSHSVPVVTTSGVTTDGLFRGFTLINGDSGFGGGMYNSGSFLNVLNCVFQANLANMGGGMANDASSPHIESCLFVGNQAHSGGGGGLYNDASSSPDLINCTFSRNEAATSGGGIYNSVGSSPAIANSILWANNPDEMDGGSPTVNFSDILGSGGLGTNIDEDPLFVNPDGDFHLLPESPCIDAGENSYVRFATDIDGDSRLIDGDCDGIATVDIGADEYLPTIDQCESDFDTDGDVDGSDLAVFANAYAAGNPKADLNKDGKVNVDDLAVFGADFGRTNCP